jgi:RimJ/RimL family protein N-acetyltransferase
LTGDVRLRRLRGSELDELVRARIAEAGTMAYPGEAPPAKEIRSTLVDRIAHSGEFFQGEILMGIELGGRLAGEIQARRPENAMPPGVFELGIGVFDAADRGKGVGSAAVGLMTKRLFEEEGAHRVQLGTDLENAPMRRVAERLGFRLEGVMRGFMPTPDGPHDYALYAITRADYEDGRLTTTWT